MIITAIDDIIDDINFDELLGSLGEIVGTALNIVIPSATNGLMNAFVTLRVGYTTIKYLEVGYEAFNSKEVRKFAIKSARKQLFAVGKAGVDNVINRTRKC